MFKHFIPLVSFCLLAWGNPANAFTEPLSGAIESVVPKEPFLTNNGLIPPPAQYKGPLFQLNHNWPAQPLQPISNPPWSKAIGGGLINKTNAAAYVAALKEYVSVNARQLLLDYQNWDAAKARWYNEPWLGSIRESIHGTYSAGQFGPEIFPGTGLKATFDTQVLTYYDERAAHTLYKVWKADAMTPETKTANFQFDEGSVIVKAAMFLSDDPKIQTDWWPVTKGAAEWPLFVGIPQSSPGPAAVLNTYVMQFDIIVKDSLSAPKTGWVFSTLVYDANASGDAWDKMVPLGVQWGNDPDVNSALIPPPPLNENWINPEAPKYSTQTLGWGDRLSGPNDGATNDIQIGTDTVLKNAPDSSCMSCHSPAQWQPEAHKALSFLLPSYPNPNPGPPYKPCPDGKPSDPYICSPAPGSADWFRWFQNRLGTEPFDPDTGSVATDFDMVFSFKTLPAWWHATGPAGQPPLFAIRPFRKGAAQPKAFNEYSGAPLRVPNQE